jgi:hypothetical protein
MTFFPDSFGGMPRDGPRCGIIREHSAANTVAATIPPSLAANYLDKLASFLPNSALLSRS